MKIFISADMEGTAGVASWEEVNKGTASYDVFSAQMSREVAAACEGAILAGADDILVKDAHDSARNIQPALLPEKARIFRGWGKHPYGMMAGLDSSFAGVMLTGYHSAAQMNTSPLSHTMNTRNNYVKINGELCPEMMISAMIAAYEGVPVYCVTGDKGICDWMREKCPGTLAVPVSEGFGEGSISIHPALAVARIREAARASVHADAKACLYPLPAHFSVEINFKEHTKAASARWYPGCRQTDSRTVAFEADDLMDVLKFFHWVL